MVSIEEFPIASSDHIPGYKIVEEKGFVYGLTVRARGIGGDIGAGLKGLLGGEIKQYVSMMEESRGIRCKCNHYHENGFRQHFPKHARSFSIRYCCCN